MKKKILVLLLITIMLLALLPKLALAVDSNAVIDKILAGDGGTQHYFGRSVAISGDCIVVGAYADDDKGAGSGAVYIYDLLSGNGTLSDVLGSELKLTANDGAAYDHFGWSVAISGDKVAVGAYGDDDHGESSGSVYIYDLSSGEGTQQDVLDSQIKLTADDGAVNDYFGKSVSISGDHVIVGAYADDDKGDSSGSVYIYDLSNGEGTQQDVLDSQIKLTASDEATNDNFGYSVAISGDRIVVGAYADDDKGASSGSVYIYDLSNGEGTQQDVLDSQIKLTANDGAAYDYFGCSVAISGDKVAVGAYAEEESSGSVYIYDLANGEGTESDVRASEIKLMASDRAEGDSFGESVSISGDKVAVGAPDDDDKGETSGSAYIYDLANGDGTESDVRASEIKLTANDGAANACFGYSVAISGDKVAVGAYGAGDYGDYTGSVYTHIGKYTISLDKQGGSGGDDSFVVTYGDDTLPSATAPSYAGYTFGGYYSETGGSGTKYYDADMNAVHEWDIEGETTLYANWISYEYTVVFNGNGADSGSMPNQSFTYGTEESLTANAFSRTNYSFAGWSTSSDGGVLYTDGQSVSNLTDEDSGTVTLYAQWDALYTLDYDKNDGEGNLPPSVTEIDGTSVTVGDLGDPDYEYHDFNGWNTERNGGGTQYAPGDSLILTANTTLYAQWEAWPMLSYDANGGFGPAPSLQTERLDSEVTVVVVKNAKGLSYDGYVFVGWNTERGGTGTPYAPGDDFTYTGVTTLYAQWEPLYTLSYDKGDGGGTAPSSQEGIKGDVVVVQSSGELNNSGYVFNGWNTERGGTGEPYVPGDSLTLTADTTLYAQWTEGSSLSIATTKLSAATLGESYSDTVTASGGDGSYTWYASGLPDGLSMDSGTGKISGKPNETGTFSARVTVYDGEGGKAEKTYTLTVNSPSATGKYEIVPDADSAYTVSTTGGFTTLTIKSGVTGFRYFEVSINPIVAHEGQETCVFVHMRNGVQIGFYATAADFDDPVKATAGFNVQPGDIIKVYVVDELSNSTGSNPVLLQ